MRIANARREMRVRFPESKARYALFLLILSFINFTFCPARLPFFSDAIVLNTRCDRRPSSLWSPKLRQRRVIPIRADLLFQQSARLANFLLLFGVLVRVGMEEGHRSVKTSLVRVGSEWVRQRDFS